MKFNVEKYHLNGRPRPPMAMPGGNVRKSRRPFDGNLYFFSLFGASDDDWPAAIPCHMIRYSLANWNQWLKLNYVSDAASVARFYDWLPVINIPFRFPLKDIFETHFCRSLTISYGSREASKPRSILNRVFCWRSDSWARRYTIVNHVNGVVVDEHDEPSIRPFRNCGRPSTQNHIFAGYCIYSFTSVVGGSGSGSVYLFYFPCSNIALAADDFI